MCQCCCQKQSCGCQSQGCGCGCKSCDCCSCCDCGCQQSSCGQKQSYVTGGCGCGQKSSCGSSKKHSCSSSSCGSGSCAKSKCEEGSCDDDLEEHVEKLLYIADKAWAEVLKEKIKEYIKANDHKIDGMARLVAEANHERWKHKMEQASCLDAYEEKLDDLIDYCFSSKCCSTHTSDQTGHSGHSRQGKDKAH